PRHDVGRLLGNRGRYPASAGLDGRLGLVAGHRLQGPREHELLSREGVGALRVRLLLRPDSRLLEAREELLVRRRVEPVVNGLGDGGPDLVDVVDLLDAGLGQAVQVPEMAGEQGRRAVADVADAQRKEEPPQLALAALLDPRQERGRPPRTLLPSLWA